MTGRPLAVVTGATAGIGAAFARQLAARSYDLILVARDVARLEATAAKLRHEYAVAVEPFPADLATEAGLASVADRLTEAEVTLLVNNAGISLNRSFVEFDPAAEERLLRVNVHAVMRLTGAVLPRMVRRQRGGVLNVSSVAGFFAVSPGSTYSATKAWVTAFSESVAYQVHSAGVRVTALCPGLVRTEFHDRAGIAVARIPGWAWLDADRVAADGLRALERGTVVRVVDWRYRLAVRAIRLLPRGKTIRLLSRIRQSRGRTETTDK
jgi:short-subunit dehydrogenase